MPEADHPLAPAFDRFQEAHFWIHMMEEYYHCVEPFRWHLNVFLKAIKEVPALVQMKLQNTPKFTAWFKQHKVALQADPLLGKLAKNRDFIVHQGMLTLKSSGSIGITKGRGMKLGLGFPIDPQRDSDAVMDQFIHALAENGDFFGFLAADEDTLPCVERYWRIPDFEEELIEVCAAAWLRVGQVLTETVGWIGEEKFHLNLNCLHSSQRVHFKLYKRKPLRARLREIRSQEGFKMSEKASDAVDLSEETQVFDDD